MKRAPGRRLKRAGCHASPVHTTPPPQVHDAIWCYQQRRDMLRRLHAYRARGGAMPPTSDSAAVEELNERLEAEEQEGECVSKVAAAPAH